MSCIKMAGEDKEPRDLRPLPPPYTPFSWALSKKLGRSLAAAVRKIPEYDYQRFSQLIALNFHAALSAAQTCHVPANDQLLPETPPPADAGERQKHQEDNLPEEPESRPGQKSVSATKPQISTAEADDQDQDVSPTPNPGYQFLRATEKESRKWNPFKNSGMFVQILRNYSFNKLRHLRERKSRLPEVYVHDDDEREKGKKKRKSLFKKMEGEMVGEGE